jgi:TPR repeat protein
LHGPKPPRAAISSPCTTLGLLLRDDDDTATGVAWLTKGAEAGGTEAMSGLAILLAGTGRAAEAEAWLAKGAAAENPVAMYNFAQLLYQQGQAKRARRWYEKAANYGLTEAIFNLGSILADSDEATDIQSAMVWLSRGAGLGAARQTILPHRSPSCAEPRASNRR